MYNCDDINVVIQENAGLIFSQLQKFYLLKDPEAISIGYEALYNAILSYDNDDKRAKFSTFAAVCIFNALGTYVRYLNRVKQLDIVSYNALQCNGDGDESEYLSILGNDQSAESVVVAAEKSALIGQAISTVRCKLNSVHKRVLDAWVTEGFLTSTVEIAKEIGVSQSYASQGLSRIKHLLRKELEGIYD